VRFTIERLRTVLLVTGTLLIVALGVSLALHTWKNPFKKVDIPKRLGIDISEEANGVTYKHTFGSHSVFQIHASRVTQLKNNHALLHNVKIELYEQDGSRVDRIEGNEFEYDQQTQIAKAAGPVAITMLKPQSVGASQQPQKAAAPPGPADEIHIKTSGLVFDQKTGVATTTERVDFSTIQGSGNSIGATYDSDHGHLVLDRQVELNVQRNGETVLIHAQHGEFERSDMICHLRNGTASYRNGEASAGEAKILFREDGTAVRLDATDGLAMATATGSRVTAPTGWLEFNDNNQPRRGHMEGGVTLDSVAHTDRGDRASHGTAPTADLDFDSAGELRHTHLERGVELTSEERDQIQNEPQRTVRTWHSPVADVEFRDAANGQVEPAWLHGVDGVVINGVTQRGLGPELPSRLAADDVHIDFGPNSAMKTMTGVGHASIEQTTATGTHQSSSGDRLDVRFNPPGQEAPSKSGTAPPQAGHEAAQIESASLVGHVIMDQVPAAKPGEPAPATMHAVSGRADYEGAGEWMHLTESPRVNDGGLQLTAEKIDVSQVSGDAFAHSDVRATWLSPGPTTAQPSRATPPSKTVPLTSGLGGQGPTHVIADEAQMHQATGEATFRGHARLWQDANSVAAPVIVLNRQKETLVATSPDPANPVHVVLLSTSGLAPAKSAAPAADTGEQKSQPRTPSVIRVSGGVLHYSDAEHKADMESGVQKNVIAETPSARSVSDRVDLTLLPPGNHASRDGGAAQVDTMTASGHVQVAMQTRRGWGTKLVYTGDTGDYVLTGTADAPPRMTDPVQGSVTGAALIFHSRDDSVSIEGGGAKTETQTRTPK
jgi:lipopolysaccharide export system protein LptA